MGYLRKNSFLIFLDSDAPSEATTSPDEIALIEAKDNEAKVQRVESLIKEAARESEDKPGDEERWREVAQRVQEVGADKNALNEYIRTTFRSTREMNWREFAHAVHEVVISKSSLSQNRYVPWRTSEGTVRFRSDGYLGVSVAPAGTRYDDEKQQYVPDGSTHASLWVRVVEGWAKDGNWGGYLQISCRTQNGKYIDSSRGWVTPVASRQDKVTFYDLGNYYEIWQGDRDSGRPLTVEDNCLRFTAGATPSKWNLQDSTWD